MSVMSAHTPFLVFSGTNSRYLAEKICNSLGCPLGQMNIQHFADGEFSVSYEESIRGRDVFLVQSTFPNADNLMELLLMIDAAKRASAHSIIAVIPYFGWARQDRKDKPRVAIGAKLIADMLSAAGINRLITMDLHADQIQGFFNVPVDHLYASSVFLEYIKNELIKENLVKDPVVTVEFANLCISVLGEVNSPGRFSIDRDRLTILDALSMAGDLTIYGNRSKVMVLRQEGDVQRVYGLNLTSGEHIYTSPAYYLQQNDVVYVEPNAVKARQSTVNGNNVRSTSFWISLASLLTSVAILIFN